MPNLHAANVHAPQGMQTVHGLCVNRPEVFVPPTGLFRPVLPRYPNSHGISVFTKNLFY